MTLRLPCGLRLLLWPKRHQKRAMIRAEKAHSFRTLAMHRRLCDARRERLVDEHVIDAHALVVVSARLGRPADARRASPRRIGAPVGHRMEEAVRVDRLPASHSDLKRRCSLAVKPGWPLSSGSVASCPFLCRNQDGSGPTSSQAALTLRSPSQISGFVVLPLLLLPRLARKLPMAASHPRRRSNAGSLVPLFGEYVPSRSKSSKLARMTRPSG